MIVLKKFLKEQGDNKSLKALKFGNDWAQSLFRRMGFKKRAAATGKVIISGKKREEAKLIYLYDIVTKIETYNIPHQLVFNMDQAPLKCIQICRYTIGKSSKKSVAIAGYSNEKGTQKIINEIILLHVKFVREEL